MLPTSEQLHKQIAIIIHEGNSCTSWEAAQEMAEKILQELFEFAKCYKQLLGMKNNMPDNQEMRPEELNYLIEEILASKSVTGADFYMSDIHAVINQLRQKLDSAVEALEDADLWIPPMREAIGGELFFQDARMENLEAWHKQIKTALANVKE